MGLQLVPYNAWVPENIVLEDIESLPWANDKIRDKATNLAQGLIQARDMELPSQVNLYFANLKRLAKKSVATSIRDALEDTGLVISPKSYETMVDVETYEGVIPTHMLNLMALVQEMIPIAQFRIGVPSWRRDPYLLIGIPGGGWWRLGSWYRDDTSHVLIDASKIDLGRLLGR